MRDEDNCQECLDESFRGRELHGRQHDLIALASLFASGFVVPTEFRLREAAMPFLDALDLAGETFSDEILASIALSEAEL
jgi:hypothetical protein